MEKVKKFKVWDTINKKMSFVAKIHYADDGFAKTVLVEAAPIGVFFSPMCVGENCELIQFTGVQDKNGKDIYEGDIIRFYDDTIEVLIEVVYDAPAFKVKYIPDSNPCYFERDWAHKHEIQIVGNIYENPELKYSPKRAA